MTTRFELPLLCIGDAAPRLAIAEWLKGEPTTRLVEGEVYVIEFWAIWCGPCIGAIPHLTNLQSKYPRAKVIGIAERKPDVAKVREFVAGKADEFGYAVALQAPCGDGKDDDRGQMSRDWLDASCSAGIPTTFIVDGSGRIAWLGHPLKVEETLIQVLDGRFDVAAAAAAYPKAAEKKKAQHLLLQALGKREESLHPADSFKEFDELAERYSDIAQTLEHFKLFQLQDKGAILACAEALLAKARGDGERLFMLGASLLNAPLGREEDARGLGSSDPDIAALGVTTLIEVEPLMRGQEQAEPETDVARWKGFWFQFNSTISRGLIGAGRPQLARARAQEALRLGKELNAPSELLDQIEKSIESL